MTQAKELRPRFTKLFRHATSFEIIGRCRYQNTTDVLLDAIIDSYISCELRETKIHNLLAFAICEEVRSHFGLKPITEKIHSALSHAHFTFVAHY